MRARPSRAARRPVIARCIAPVPSVGVASSKNLRRAEGISARTGRNRLQSAPAWGRLRAMSSRARLSARLALATVVLPSLAFAQDNIVPFGQEDSPRAHLRDRYRKPESSQKLSDSVRKLKSEDVEERLEAIHTLGQIDDPKATEALVGVASELDMRVRLEAVDTLGRAPAGAPPSAEAWAHARLPRVAVLESAAGVKVGQNLRVAPSRPMRERHEAASASTTTPLVG